jgi:hypothetical protein
VQTGRRYIVKRYWILLLTLGVVFVLAVPVAATPGDEAWCIDHRDHLKCVESPSEDPGPAFSTVCGGEVEDGTPFEVDLGGRKTDLLSSARVDVMSDGGAWVVEVEVLEGTLRGMSIFIRDSIGRDSYATASVVVMDASQEDRTVSSYVIFPRRTHSRSPWAWRPYPRRT